MPKPSSSLRKQKLGGIVDRRADYTVNHDRIVAV